MDILTLLLAMSACFISAAVFLKVDKNKSGLEKSWMTMLIICQIRFPTN